MNIGKVLGISLTLVGVISGIITFGVTGAVVGSIKIPGFFWVISGIAFIMGIFIFLMSIERDSKSSAEIEPVKVFSENEKEY
jgi:hypothetical protein